MSPLISSSLLLSLFSCGGALLAQDAAAPAKPAPAGAPLRLLVLPSTEAGVRAEATQEVVERLTTGLVRQGVWVVDAAQAARLAGRSKQVFDQFLGAEPAAAANESMLGVAADADLVVVVGVTVEQEVQQQGRYRVRDRMRLRLIGAEEAAVAWNEAFDGTGQSLDSYLIAHRVAAESMCSLTDANSAVGKLVQVVQTTAAQERERGSTFKVALHSDREDAELVASLGQALAAVGIADSVQQVGSGKAGDGGAATREFAEFALRFRGTSSELQSHIATAIDKLPVAEGFVRNVSFLGSRRRLDLVVRTRKVERSLGAEVEHLVNGAVNDLVARNEAGLQGKKIAVLATDVPAVAKSKSLPADIATWLRGSFQSAAKKVAEVLPGDEEQQQALELIGKEAQLHREQGAVDPATIAFLQRAGAGVAVMSSLHEVLKRWQLVVSMIDLNTGSTARHVTFVPDSFHGDLAREVGGN